MAKKYYLVKAKRTYDVLYAFSTEGDQDILEDVEKKLHHAIEMDSDEGTERVYYVSTPSTEEEFLADYDKRFPELAEEDAEYKLDFTVNDYDATETEE